MKVRALTVLIAGLATLPGAIASAQTPPRRPKVAPRPADAPSPAPAPKPARTPEPPDWFDLELDLPRFKERAALAAEEWRIKAELEAERWRDRWADLEVTTPLAPMPAIEPMIAVAPRVAIEAPFVEPMIAMAPMALSWGEDARWTRPPRPAWAPHDQGDSLYRVARELLNQGEYRRAAAAFREIANRTPTSAYAADALYYQAFALYRIGGTDELRAALAALEAQRAKYPGARMQAETSALAMRINGALAARGDAAARAQVASAVRDSALQCDREEMSVRAEALNALTQSDIDAAMPVLQRTLARKDECSAMLRRTAVFLVGSKRRDGGAVGILSQVARTDPSIEVRASALEWLARVPGEDALSTLEELSRDASEERVQRAAVRALVQHPSTRARTLVRGIVERPETPERLRLEALGAFDKERSTAEDITWMRALYGRTENPRIKARLVSTLSNIGGPEVEQWMLTVARNPDEDSDTRRNALRRVGRTLSIADLSRLYDASAERTVRESIIETLAQRNESEAIDKLIDIVKTGTDPRLRQQAISALTRKKDPRAMKLLMEIIDK